MHDSLKGQRVVITAAAAGIGRATAESFLAAGAKVHVCDVDSAGLDALASELPGIGVTLADVAEPDQVDRLFDEAEAHLGGLDAVVNNAGIAGPTAAVEDIAIEDWRRTLAIDLDGTFYCLRRAVPLLKQAGGGSIVNLSSSAGIFGFPNRAPYVASKWAIVGLTKTLAMELGSFGIRANAICPGPVSGPRIERVIAASAETQGVDPDEVRQNMLRQISMRSMVSAQDIANTILFLCSDLGNMISGQALPVDGHTESLAN